MPNQLTREQRRAANKAQLQRLVRAYEEYRQHPPKVVTRKYVEKLADRHMVNYKNLVIAFDIEMEMENETLCSADTQ